MRWIAVSLVLLVPLVGRAQTGDDPYVRADRALRAAFTMPPEGRAEALERAAMLLVAAVDGAPGDARAPVALSNAAIAFDGAGRPESARRLYRRVIDEVGPVVPTPETSEALDELLVNAHLRCARLDERADERERALEHYRAVADSGRFERSGAYRMRDRIDEAVRSAAHLLDGLGRPTEAGRYFLRAAERTSDPDMRRDLYWAATTRSRSGDPAAAIRAHRDFMARYARDPAAVEQVAEARAWVERQPASSAPPRAPRSSRPRLRKNAPISCP